MWSKYFLGKITFPSRTCRCLKILCRHKLLTSNTNHTFPQCDNFISVPMDRLYLSVKTIPLLRAHRFDPNGGRYMWLLLHLGSVFVCTYTYLSNRARASYPTPGKEIFLDPKWLNALRMDIGYLARAEEKGEEILSLLDQNHWSRLTRNWSI